MLKTFLKHHIYEYCIQALFNGISNNFYHPSLDGLILGHRYKEVQFIREHKWGDDNYLTDIYRDVVFDKIHKDENGHDDIWHGDSTSAHFNTKEIEYMYNVSDEHFTENFGGSCGGIEYKVTEEYDD
jgi:hypothetical protein